MKLSRCRPPSPGLSLFVLIALQSPTAAAVDFSSQDAVESVGSGQINWSEASLKVTSGSERTVGAWKDRRVQEQDALEGIAPRIQEAAKRTCVAPGHEAGDFLDQETDLSRRLRDGLDGWAVVETRYHTPGGVEMDGALQLGSWLLPLLTSLAEQGPNEPPPLTTGDSTGLLIDARSQSFQPCLAPSIRTEDGVVLVDVDTFDLDATRRDGLVQYVTDPVDTRAMNRLGPSPTLLVATDTDADAELIVKT
ncbi:MAG: hypothetical protein QGG40_22235, partial [Myxococcota bacterium]|nr:hypothetical protein [Myxococcota bacterium]